MGQWSDLPRELLVSIEQLLVLYVDKVRVRAVCMSWNLHLLPKMPNHQGRRLPWLLHSFENNTEASHGLFDLSEKKFYNLDLPEAQGKLFKGSSLGWLVTVQDIPYVHGDGVPIVRSISSSSADMYLVNPLTRAQIQLPPRYTFPDVVEYVADRIDEEYAIWDPRYGEAFPEHDTFSYHDSENVNFIFMYKVVISSIPSSEDCLVVAIYGEVGKLAYCKCNDKQWTPLLSGRYHPTFEDIIFYEGKLHALNCKGELLVFENLCPTSEGKEIAKLSMPIAKNYPMYLVECSDGGLVMVTRKVDMIGEEDSLTHCTLRFEVYKLDSINSIWFRVKNIGDDILFLGLNSSFSISSRDFPGYKGNSIYFTDSSPIVFAIRAEKHACSDIGVFNLEDESFELVPGFICNPKFLWPPAVWVMPQGNY